MFHATLRAAGGAALPVSFEAAAAALEALPRLYFEPDGSFVWVAASERAWQLEGQLQDRGPQLDHVEIKGTCTPDGFAQFLAAFGWPGVALELHLVSEGRTLSAAEFMAQLPA